MTKVITVGNFKGGVGKTTNATMLSYTLARQGYKTLIVDLDAQFNATRLMLTTMQKVFGNKPDFEASLEIALKDGDLNEALIHIHDNLDLLPSYEDLENYTSFLNDSFVDDYKKDTYFATQLEKIKHNYDYIFLDVPPQLNKQTDSALVASDYVLIVLQSQEYALAGAQTYQAHIEQLKDDYGLDLRTAGILPVLLQNGNKTDKEVINDAQREFGKDMIFNIKIRQMARLKRFTRTGITYRLKRDINDRRVHYVYSKVAQELLERMD